MGYRAWAECYISRNDGASNDKAEKILLDGYTRGEPRDRYEMAANLISLYEDTGRPEMARKFEKLFHELGDSFLELKEDRLYDDEQLMFQRSGLGIGQDDKSAPVKAVKIGRNVPCPCGSGKKFKKCCGV